MLNMWCPPPRDQKGIEKCTLCRDNIDLDRRERHFYAVWAGFICPECWRLFDEEIEELSKL